MKLIFKNVSKIHKRKQQAYNLLNVSASLLDTGSIAVLSQHERSSKSLLNLISGLEQPTRGSIERDGLFTGPIGDAAFFHRELSGEENIRFICKIYGQKPSTVLNNIKEFANLGKELQHKIKTYSPAIRRKIAISMSLFIKSDVYQLTGPLNHPNPEFNAKIERKLVEIENRAILVIATNNQAVLNKYAKCSVVIDGQGNLSKYDNLTSGINAHTALKQPS